MAIRIRKASDPGAFIPIKRALIAVRVLLFVGVIIIIIGASILNLSLWKAGALILMITFVGLGCIHISLLSFKKWRGALPKVQRMSLAVAAAALPALLVRAVYIVVIEFSQDEKLNPIMGDPAYLIGMGYTMELLVIISLLSAAVVSEELFGFRNGSHGVTSEEKGNAESTC